MSEEIRDRSIAEGEQARKRLDWRRFSAQTIFDTTPCASVIFDRQFEVVDCNEAAVRTFGASSRDDLIARGASLLQSCIMAPDGEPVLIGALKRARRH